MDRGIAPFLEVARRYCAWAEAEPLSADEEAYAAVRLLAALLDRVQGLPGGRGELEADQELLVKGDATEKVYRRFTVLPFQYYHDVFHPTRFPCEPAAVGDLADDLMDIYADVKQGVWFAESGHPDEAAFHWRFTFGVHWGRHAVSALRALHCHLTDQKVE